MKQWNKMRMSALGIALVVFCVGCQKEEAPAPAPAPKEAPAFNLENEALKTYTTWAQTGAAIEAAREYLSANPKAKDADVVIGQAVRVSLDAALTAAVTGDASAIESLGLDGSDVAAVTKSIEALLTDRLGVKDRDAVIGLARALNAPAEERAAALKKVMDQGGSFGARAASLVMAELQPNLGKIAAVRGDELSPEQVKGLLLQASELLAVASPEGDVLSGLFDKTRASLAKAATVRVAFPLPSDGDDPATGKPVEALEGPAWNQGPFGVIAVTATGVGTGARPILSSKDAAVEMKDGVAQEAMTLEVLLAKPEKDAKAEEEPETGVQQFAKLIQAADAAWKEATSSPVQGVVAAAEGVPASAYLQIGKDVKAEVLLAVSEAVSEAGVGTARWVTGPNSRDYVPVVMHTAKNAGESATMHYNRPVLVQVKEGSVDLFAPRKRLDTAPADHKNAAPEMPKEAKPWYLGEKVFKYEIAAGEAQEAALNASVEALGKAFGTGNVVFVEAAPGASAEAVALAARAVGNLQKGGGVDAAKLYAGVECGDELKCPSRVAVVLTGAAVPNKRGLTEEPTKKEVKAKPAPKPAKPKASPVFCNKGDIKKVMGGKKNAFKFCYSRVLQLYPDLQGKVKATFIIKDGATKATSARIAASQLKNDKVHACLLKNIKKLNFNPPTGGDCAVSWPWTFKN